MHVIEQNPPHRHMRPVVKPLPPRWADLARLGDKPLPSLGRWQNQA